MNVNADLTWYLSAVHNSYKSTTTGRATTLPYAELSMSESLEKVVSKLFRHKTRRDALSLLHLPYEILECIFNALLVSSKILLSQTCKYLWVTFRDRCIVDMRKLSRNERLRCLSALGGILPDHRTCSPCRSLHLIDPGDTPIVDTWQKFFDSMPVCANGNETEDRVWHGQPLDLYYGLAFRHVQSAVKYTRFQGLHDEYRNKILKPFKMSGKVLDMTTLKFSAKPKVVNGCFLLKTKWEFRARDRDYRWEFYNNPGFTTCPHMADPMVFTNLQSPRWLLILNKELHSDPRRLLSCHACPSDYLIEMSDMGDRLKMQAWQNLGSGHRHDDPRWASQIRGGRYQARHWNARFDYEHGSVKRMYEDDANVWDRWRRRTFTKPLLPWPP